MTSKENCIFCQISKGEKDTVKIYQNENYCAFKDCRPATSHHYLIIPKTHYKDAKSLKNNEAYIISDMVEIGNKILTDYGIEPSSSRMGFHWPPFHTVSHLHLHVIANEYEMGCISRIIFKTNSFWFISPDIAVSRLQDETTLIY